MKMNIEELTVGEMVLFEDVAGMSMGALAKNTESMKVIRALIFIQARRDNPEITLADVDAMTMSDITEGDDEPEVTPDPTGPDA